MKTFVATALLLAMFLTLIHTSFIKLNNFDSIRIKDTTYSFDISRDRSIFVFTDVLHGLKVYTYRGRKYKPKFYLSDSVTLFIKVDISDDGRWIVGLA